MIPGNMKIVVYDDDENLRRDWKRRLDRFIPSESLLEWKKDDLTNAVKELEDRRMAARDKREASELKDLGAAVLDDIAIFLVDFDLLGSTNLTGEEIAYLVRCYSKCDVVVAINQFGENTFDLTLRGHPESFADLNIGADHFDSAGLWFQPEKWRSRFRPSAWPILPQLVRDSRQRVREALSALGEPVLTFLELGDEDRSGILPRAALDFISAKGLAPEEITIEDFVRHSEQGLRRRDETAKEGIARIAAARLHKWLERLVLGGQDILVSAPHLVDRLPSLLSGPVDRVESWDAVVCFDRVSGLKEELVSEDRFAKTEWLTRPAWYWHGIREYASVLEVEGSWAFEPAPFVFCEDLCRFRLRDGVYSFAADVPSPVIRRFVAKVRDIEYRPTTRLLD